MRQGPRREEVPSDWRPQLTQLEIYVEGSKVQGMPNNKNNVRNSKDQHFSNKYCGTPPTCGGVNTGRFGKIVFLTQF